MKVLIFVVALFAVAAGEFCYSSTKLSCDQDTTKGVNCTAAYGLAHNYIRDLQIYANMHITRNFQYLLMSSHFGNYRKEREGFKKLYRKLSDTAWQDAIDLIKYIAMRGGKMDFHYDEDGSDVTVEVSPHAVEHGLEGSRREGRILSALMALEGDDVRSTIAMSELESLGKSLDIQKKLALKAHEIYKASHRHDPEISDYVEDKFMHKHAKTIRNLAGYTRDLSRLLEGEKDTSAVGLKLFILDSYLEKVV
ncbi:hypothetical protein R5R35_014272 [Gryllus longicercus]|uniref:Ferritin n=1 Tax=Gryllus longicercus TaxID=2509291 RepID=A0AAN9VYU4_9ORTH